MIARTFANSFGLLVSRLGLEPRNLAVPDFKSVLQFAVRGFTKTQLYKSVRCVYQFRQRLIFRTLKSFADLRHTLYNLQPYSISRETRSEHWVATPILPAPRDFHPLYNPWRTSITLISCRNDYLHLSPAIQNCYIIFYYLPN